MCGVAGIVNFDRKAVEPSLLRAMIQRVQYRGPDESGVYTDAEVGLAHTRLSILDLSRGHQPMQNADHSLTITFNGEIFNFLELREELRQAGHTFASHSDTEVLLRLYEEKGEECVHDLNGQWALAIWDARARKLFLSRDRLGVRPLFYTVTDQAFAFASERKSLLSLPGARRELDFVALDQIFTFWTTLPPRTIFKGILELPPGHSLTVQQGRVSVRRYWQLDYQDGSLDEKPEQGYVEQLRELLVDATRIRLRSDVPVGAYLSGGLDSTIVTALIKKFTSAPLQTFSVTFDDAEYDESAHQKAAVRHLDTVHSEIHCSLENIGEFFPEVIWHAEQPILRTAPTPLFLLSRAVRAKGYKVVLTGEGSDEVFGGYDIFKEAKIREFWARNPGSALRPLLLRRLYPYLPGLQRQPDAYLRAFFHVKPEDLDNPFFSHLPRWELTSQIKRCFSRAVQAEIMSYDGYAELRSQLPEGFRGWERFCRAQYLEAALLLPGYILSSQGDRVAMAHSVEGRFPFLDHRVVEFASRIPPSLKMKVLNEKYLLKRCFGDLLPRAVLERPKQPYRAPEGRSFFHARRPAYVQELLSPSRIREDGIFDPLAVRKLVEKFQEGRGVGVKDNMALVGILSTQLVADQFLHTFGRRSLDASTAATVAPVRD